MSLLAAVVLLLTALPFAFIAAWSDLKSMIISNRLNLCLAGAFLVVGILVLPLGDYGYRVAIGVGLLVFGFVLNAIGVIGGGDAKYIAAFGPFIAPRDWPEFLMILGVMGVSALVALSIAKRIPAYRRAAGHWKSTDAGRHFPYGLALSGALILYLALNVWRAAGG